MIDKLKTQLPWCPITSAIMILTKEDISFEQQCMSDYIECIFYFNNSSAERVEEIFKKIEKGIQEAIITDCSSVDMLFNDAIAIRQWRKQEQ